MTLEEAKSFLRQRLKKILTKKGFTLHIKIITGKGIHSGPEGGVLCKNVHSFVRQEFSDYIASIDESPNKIKLSGIPFRGYFSVLMKF